MNSMTDSYIIRPIQPEDDAAVAALIRRCLEDAGLDRPGTAYCDPQLNHLAEFYAGLDRPGCYWVAEAAEGRDTADTQSDPDAERPAIIGAVGVAAWDNADDICELQKLYVAANRRGQGIGRRLTLTALGFVSAHYRRCYLETHSSLTAACGLYQSLGFTFLDTPLGGGEHSTMDMWAVKELHPQAAA